LKIDTQLLQWIYVAVAAPLLGWLGAWLHQQNKARRSRKARVEFLRGLPEEAKLCLLGFYHNKTHTMRGDPGAPVVRYLTQMKVLHVGTGGGTFDAVDRYLTVMSAYWSIFDRWLVADPDAIRLLAEHLHDELENQ